MTPDPMNAPDEDAQTHLAFDGVTPETARVVLAIIDQDPGALAMIAHHLSMKDEPELVTVLEQLAKGWLVSIATTLRDQGMTEPEAGAAIQRALRTTVRTRR